MWKEWRNFIYIDKEYCVFGNAYLKIDPRNKYSSNWIARQVRVPILVKDHYSNYNPQKVFCVILYHWKRSSAIRLKNFEDKSTQTDTFRHAIFFDAKFFKYQF